jgi:hypothetical protein
MLPCLPKCTAIFARDRVNVANIFKTHIKGPERDLFDASFLMMYHLTSFLFRALEVCSVDDNASSLPLKDDAHTWIYSIYHKFEFENMMVIERLEIAFGIGAYKRAKYLAKNTNNSVSEFLGLAINASYRTLKAISKSISCIRSKTMSARGVSQLSICLLTLCILVILAKEHWHLYGCEAMADGLKEFCVYYITYLRPDWLAGAGEKSKEPWKLLIWGMRVVAYILEQDISDLDLDEAVRITSS